MPYKHHQLPARQPSRKHCRQKTHCFQQPQRLLEDLQAASANSGLFCSDKRVVSGSQTNIQISKEMLGSQESLFKRVSLMAGSRIDQESSLIKGIMSSGGASATLTQGAKLEKKSSQGSRVVAGASSKCFMSTAAFTTENPVTSQSQEILCEHTQ